MSNELERRIVTLRNGLRVANFSSPHPFKFTDGTILPEVDSELAKSLSLRDRELSYTDHNRTNVKTIEIIFELTDIVKDELDMWYVYAAAMEIVDIVIVPLPIMQCLREIWDEKILIKAPFRTVRLADRISKIIHPDKFCI